MKFGRDLGPEDPVFFDPNADVPTPMSPDRWHAALNDLIDRAEEIGIDRALLHAWRQLGYVVTEQNRHLFSAADIEAWHDAVDRYTDDVEDLDDEVGFGDLVDVLADELEQAVARTFAGAFTAAGARRRSTRHAPIGPACTRRGWRRRGGGAAGIADAGASVQSP